MIGERFIKRITRSKTFAKEIKSKEMKSETKPIKLGEVSLSDLSYEWARDWDIYNVNPDAVLEKKGWDFYKEVARDDQVHTCEKIKKTARLSSPWFIQAASEDLEDERIAAFVEFAFNNMKGTFSDKLKQMYSAFEYGFSVTEKTYDYIDNGEWKGYVGLKYLKTRDPANLDFDLDRFGNIKQVVQKKGFKKITLKPSDVVRYAHDSEFGNPYGRGDIQFVYRSYISKKWTQRFWNIALERFGMGLTVMTFEPGYSGQKEYLEKIMDNLQARTGVILPKGIEMEILNSVSAGSDVYRSALDRHDKAIARGIQIPDLLGFSEFAKGSFALGKKHFDTFLWILGDIGIETQETIVNEQIIKPLVNINFANVSKYPTFEFEPLVKEDVFNIVKTFSAAVRLGAIVPNAEDAKYTRKLLGYPEVEEKAAEAEKAAEGAEETEGTEGTEEKFAKKKSPFPLRALQIFDYKKVKKDWDDIENSGIEKLEAIMKRIKINLLKTIEKKNLLSLEKGNITDIDKLQLKYIGDFRNELRNSLITAYLTAKLESLKELRKLGIELPEKFAQNFAQNKDTLTTEQALEFFKGKIPIKKSELQYYIRKAFTVTGAEREMILKDAKLILYETFRGKPRREVKKALDDMFKKYIKTGELRQVTKGQYKLFSGYHIENIVRTNVAEAVNQGRRAMMEYSDVKNFVVAYTNAVIEDENTTDFCLDLIGLVFAKEEYEFPPYHYQCRTSALPVVEGELYQITKWRSSPYKNF